MKTVTVTADSLVVAWALISKHLDDFGPRSKVVLTVTWEEL